MAEPSGSSLSPPLAVSRPITHDRDDESLFSEADSEENTESEVNLGCKYLSHSEIVIGDTIYLEKVTLSETLSNCNPFTHDVDTDDEDDDSHLQKIFYMMIPDEITKLIFNRLDLPSKQASRLVCNRWNHLIECGNVVNWHPRLTDETGQVVLKFAQKGLTAATLEIGKLDTFDYPVHGLDIKVKSIEFTTSFTSPVIVDPDSRIGIANISMDKLMYEYHPHLEQLVLNSRAFSLVYLPSPFKVMAFANLVSLEISAANADGRGYFVCLDALENAFPKLCRFKIRTLYHTDAIFLQHPPNYKEIFQFLVKQSKSLTDVCISYCNLADESSIPPFIFDLDHTIPTRVYQEIMTGLEKVQLQNLELSPTFYEGRSRFRFGTQLMNSQERLTTLKLTNLSRPNFSVWESAITLMRSCASTLKSIICEGCFCPENRPLDQFSCGIVRNCKNLEDIRISICGLKITDVEMLPSNSIKILHMGRGLSISQINFIVTNLIELEEWYLPQDRAQFDRSIPKTSIGIFKAAIKHLPKLKKLILTKRCSSWKRIRKIISYTQGLEVEDRDPSDVKDAYYVKIVIDRNRLEIDRL